MNARLGLAPPDGGTQASATDTRYRRSTVPSRSGLAGIVLAAHLLVLLALGKAPPSEPPVRTVMIAVLPSAAPPAPITPAAPPAPAAPKRTVPASPPLVRSAPLARPAAPGEAPATSDTAAPPASAPARAQTSSNPPAGEAAAQPTDSPANYHAAYLHNPQPPYPLLSRKLREEGKVRLRVRVSAAGRAEAVELVASSGFSRLDEAAHSAVATWQFVPARQQGQAVAGWVEVPIQFNLEK
jgi:periplasmic protein TonB